MIGGEAIWPHESTSRVICAPQPGRAQRIRLGHPCIGSSAVPEPLVRRPIGEGVVGYLNHSPPVADKKRFCSEETLLPSEEIRPVSMERFWSNIDVSSR
ncbi:hypothetical protein TNCV_1091011 [Trichonephila clavipes]|uniref:Uncharacterized protein n=1 Tax=Trichonephila clavipes TaxID=2585209 RepID=A0A8X6T2Q9_TRICX|nr:hypothetical protein TNCV_1091011 [Trichonephila clavipes]